MIRFEAGPEDVLRSRFALSPGFELGCLLRLLSRSRVPGWASRLVPRFGHLRQDLAFRALLAMQTAHRGPTFTVPPPAKGMLQSIEDDLAALRAVPLEVARADIAGCLAPRQATDPEILALLNARNVREEMAQVLERAWKELLAADWLQLRALCERDVLHRSGQLARNGWAAALDGLHPKVRWRDGGIELTAMTAKATVPLGGQGLLFIPTVFSYPRVSVHFEEPWPKSLIYPARGTSTLRDAPESPPEALQELIGRSRALILQSLYEPASTTQLSRSLKLAPGSVNDHLRAMQRAGLLDAARSGRSVLYRRTPLGDMLANA
ncbi:DUF5937 family protein [Catelliglobosispora koreensis]|uniref:DUF5937 family protein n=1 Tax=Catelliglobosispora koreensis TaxID=129052 RepID=UPI000381701C|nr:DUF5937 family protein [Catelliglobosispora koreensis]